jgi:serine/threonine protein kinase
VQTAFLAAVQHHDAATRATILDRECSGDGELRQRVEAMLKAHDQFHSFLHEPRGDLGRPTTPGTGPEAEGLEYTVAAPPAGFTDDLTALTRAATVADGTVVPPRAAAATAEGPDTCIGPYKLLRRIGQGGMGVVYVAEQEQPVRRRVALKIIKPGMDSEQVIGRFQAERQALAMMDHPSIARVYDAGTTDSGRPYFVMELVLGIPITEYCDQVRLTPRERLELFIEVCQAIQHAHQKGIIHRDIKPSNVLVTLYDGQPVPKVIDFGVAKATDQRLTEQPMLTQYGTIVGTLEYMSPEQAEFSALGVDTRSDVYALGVLLYELLTGSTPLERDRLTGAGYAEILEWIREKEPPRPSIRLSSSGELLEILSGQRSTEPARLTKLLRGELDWIVMKALEKDRTRRYETASSFARDVRHFLDGDPVEACPPSASYRLWKLARKHRAALATVSAFAALLVVGTAVSTWQAIAATRAEVRATREARHALAAEAQATAEGQRARHAASEAQAVLSFFQDQVLAAARPEGQDGGLGRDVTVRHAVDAAEPQIAAAFPNQPGVEAAIRHTLGSSYSYLGEPARAIQQLQRALELRTVRLGPDHPDTLTTQNNLALACQAAGRWDQAIPLFEKTLAARTAQLGAQHPSTLLTQTNLARAYHANGRWDRAIPLLEQTLAARSARLGPDHLTPSPPRTASPQPTRRTAGGTEPSPCSNRPSRRAGPSWDPITLTPSPLRTCWPTASRLRAGGIGLSPCSNRPSPRAQPGWGPNTPAPSPARTTSPSRTAMPASGTGPFRCSSGRWPSRQPGSAPTTPTPS